MELKFEFKRSRKGLPVFADSWVANVDVGLGFLISGGPTKQRDAIVVVCVFSFDQGLFLLKSGF